MNKDIKRLATTLRKGLRNFLGIEQDSEALIGLLDLVTERQKELGKTLLDIQNHNVTFHKVTMSKKVRTLMESLEDDIKSVRYDMDDLEYRLDDAECSIENHTYDYDHYDEDEIQEIASNVLKSASIEVSTEATIRTE